MFRVRRWLGVFISFCCLSAYAAQDVNSIILSKEKEFLAEMKKKKLPPAEIFEAYITAGEEFSRSNEFKWAAYFFGKATKLSQVKGKLPAYYHQMASLLALPDEGEARKLFPEMEKEFKKDKRNDDDRARLLLYKVLTSTKLHDEVLSAEELKFLKDHGRFFGGIKRHDIKIYFDRSNFNEIAGILDGESIKRANVDEKILFDLANTLATKQEIKKPLLCQNQYEQFPQSRDSSYTMTICHMLMEVRANKRPSAQEYKKAEEIISTKFPHSMYLLPVLKKLL